MGYRPGAQESGRFGDSVYLKPPSYKDRKELFKYYTKNKPVGQLDFGRLSRATMGFSPADIERVARTRRQCFLCFMNTNTT